jgi:hypothetical protein
MAKVAKIYDGTAWVDLATSVPDLSNYQLKSESGLQFVKKQTIGTAVSSVTVTDAFSATYENYKIIVSGGVASTTNVCYLKLGATATGYYWGLKARNWAGSDISTQASNGSDFYAMEGTTSTLNWQGDLFSPFASKFTVYNSGTSIATRADGYYFTVGGYLANTTSYTDFTLTASTGTLTGGTIYVYGYNKG